MINRVRDILTPPESGNDESQMTARVIHLIAAGTIALSLLFFVLIPILSPELRRRVTVLVLLIAPANLGIMWLVRNGRLQLGGIALVILIWLAVTAGSITAGGVSAPIFMGYLMVILVSGLLYRNRASFYITLFCIATGIFIAVAEENGALPPAREYTPLSRLGIYSFFLLVALLLEAITSGALKQLLKYARQSEERYKSLLESIPTITYINSTGLEARTEYVSPQVEKLAGYSHREFLANPSLWTKIVHPADLERVLEENAHTVQSGEPFQLEYRLLTKDGRTIWVHDEAILVRDSDGKPQYWLGVWTDITTRKQAQEEQAQLLGEMTKRTIQLETAAEISRATSSLLDINTLLPTVVDLIRDHFDYYYVGIFLLDDAKEWATLRAATGEVGKRLIEMDHRLPVSDSSMIGWCIRYRQARLAADADADSVRFKNPYLPLTRSEMTLPLITHGEVIGAMTIQSEHASAFSPVDITALRTIADQIANALKNARLFTERVILSNELATQNAELERFTYTVSHDLRSPLVTIRGFLGYLRQDAVSGDMPRFDKDLSRIANAVDKMQTLLNDLLELSRIGRIVNPLKDISFGQIVHETVELLTGTLTANHIRLDVQDDFPNVLGDHARLSEVMQNLISNAAKFMGNQPNPTIAIGTDGTDVDEKIIFFVRDNGIGIEPQYHEQIFGLFNRLDPTIDGTGVGLTLVKRIIEIHGGRIWLMSKPGEGATFYFTLPPSQMQ